MQDQSTSTYGVNSMTSEMYNNIFMEPQLGSLGDDATGIYNNIQQQSRPGQIFDHSEYQYPTDQAFMVYCQSCNKSLVKEKMDIFIFKGEYAYCSEQCRRVAIDMEEEMEKAEAKARKHLSAKRLENIGKMPVFLHIGRGSSSVPTKNK